MAQGSGLDKGQVTARLRRVIERAPATVAGAMYVEAEIEMTESKKLVPVQYGHLRASGHVRQPEVSGRTVTVVLGYGGPAGTGSNTEDVGYAIPVHEDLEAHHTVGQARYLSSVLDESVPFLVQRIARRLDLGSLL